MQAISYVSCKVHCKATYTEFAIRNYVRTYVRSGIRIQNTYILHPWSVIGYHYTYTGVHIVGHL